jgi:hypothetical protein
MLSPLLIFMGGALGLIGVGLALRESARLKG